MKILFKQNLKLSEYTTFKVGGKAKYFVKVNNRTDLEKAVRFADNNKVPVFVLGGGSDILVSDKGFPGLVIQYLASSIDYKDNGKYVTVKAMAGLNWDKMVENCVKKGLQGIECLSGIPGTVGAAPIQNIGAYGQELKDTFIELTAYDLKTKKFVNFDRDKCNFSYRDSIFKDPKSKSRYIIVDIILKLKKSEEPLVLYESLSEFIKSKGIIKPNLSQVRKAVLELRKVRLEDPEKVANAGSFFKNPVVSESVYKKLKKQYTDIPAYNLSDGQYKLFAGWLVETSGWRGKTYGRAKVSDKHALVLTNPSKKATAKEIKTLAQKISNDVYKIFGVRLEPEVHYVGF